MNATLYFLRSSEQHIINEMLTYALAHKTVDMASTAPYSRFYGLNNKDMGLYALVDNQLAGAVWIRLYKESDDIHGYLNESTPVIVIGIKPEYVNIGIEKVMFDQLFLEAGAMYDTLSISVLRDSNVFDHYLSLGFMLVDSSEADSPSICSEYITMFKKLNKASVVRPSDGYDPRRWMD